MCIIQTILIAWLRFEYHTQYLNSEHRRQTTSFTKRTVFWDLPVVHMVKTTRTNTAVFDSNLKDLKGHLVHEHGPAKSLRWVVLLRIWSSCGLHVAEHGGLQLRRFPGALLLAYAAADDRHRHHLHRSCCHHRGPAQLRQSHQGTRCCQIPSKIFRWRNFTVKILSDSCVKCSVRIENSLTGICIKGFESQGTEIKGRQQAVDSLFESGTVSTIPFTANTMATQTRWRWWRRWQRRRRQTDESCFDRHTELGKCMILDRC